MTFSIFRRYAPVAILLAVWEGSSRLGLIDPESLPPFSAVCAAWWDLLLSGDLVHHGISSLENLLAGLSLAIVVGVTLGVVMGRVQLADDIFGPLLNCIYPLPKAALIPVLIMWLGMDNAPKIVAVFIGSLLPIVTSAYNGARGIDRMLVWSALSAGAGRWAVLWDVVLPGAMPEILSGLRNALALSFILLVSAELLIGQRGLGYLISFLGEGGTFAGMFAGVLTVSAVGFLCDRVYLHVMRRTLSWQGE
jgi:NitT/TauT family transport system permease protein